MTLIKRNNGLTGFRSLLSDFLEADDPVFLRHWNGEGVPAVNISESEKSYEIEIAAPGMKKDDFKVNVNEGVLKISAEHKEENEEKKKNYTRQEYSYNTFERSFTLPDNARDDNIKATYEDGVLLLSIEKKTLSVSKAKEITIT